MTLSSAIASLALGWSVLQVPPPAEPARTVVEQERDDDGLDAQRTMQARNPGFGTVVELEHERGARPQDGLPEVLNRTPATTVRSLGGLGQFASVSIRGSSSQQVRVTLDGVPLDAATTGTADVGAIPLDGLRRVEVYRGFVPVTYSGATMGGVVNLVGEGVARRRAAQLWLGFGSFGTRDVGAALAVPVAKDVSLRLRAGYGASAGNFTFFDDGNTPALSADDGVAVRENNDYERVQLSMRLDGRRGATRGFLQVLGNQKDQGVPGRGSAQSTQTRLRSADIRLIFGTERRGVVAPGGSLKWVGSVALGSRAFSDPLGEVGLGVDDQTTEAFDAYLSPRVRVPVWRNGFVVVVSDLRSELVSVDEAVPPSEERSGDAKRRRFTVGTGLSLEQFLNDRRLQLIGGLRVDALANRFAVGADEGEFDEAGTDSTTLALTPRLGMRAKLAEGLSLRLSTGRYFRAPTLTELFGDQGYVLGREDLRPESGTNFDVGFAFDRKLGRRERWGAFATVAGFASFSEDLIAWVQAGPVVRPVNLEGARIAGGELSGQVTAPKRWVIAQANYTFTDTLNLSSQSSQNGQPLPGRPRHQAFGRVSVGREFGRHRWEPRAFYGVDFVAASFLDPSGRYSLPPRNFHNTGVELHIDRRVDLAFEVRNLLDQRQVSWQPPIAGEAPVPTAVVDFIGYPLPGRSIWTSVRIRW